jgi:hypothetical protein
VLSKRENGLQQAIGLVLTDFVDGLLLEVHDSWHNGFCDGVDQEYVGMR